MNAVWSFWSKPYLKTRKSIWDNEKQHFLSWILSFHQGRKFFANTVLFTDDHGARMLVDGLQLGFDVVSTSLNILDNYDPRWWALGKIFTYGAQLEPFIHIDSDVFLWKPLPVNSDTPLFAQNPEYFEIGASFYMPDKIEFLIRENGGWLPGEWIWYRSSGQNQRAESCGVFGGGNIEFIRYYAKQALVTIEHPANAVLWASLGEEVERNILVEQYLLSACIEYYKKHQGRFNQAVDIGYLFNSMDEAFNPMKAADAGYTHLIADTKKNRAVTGDLEKRVENDYPDAFEKCLIYYNQNR